MRANHKVQRDSKLIQFRPFLGDDGLIRASRRLQLSDLEEDTKRPVIMADHVLTVLLFRFIHESNMHLGVEGCVALARRRFATIACRRLFRRIKTRCTVCKSFDGPTCGGSEASPPLPVDRVTLQRSFHRNRQQRIKTTFISPDSTATTRQSAIFDSLLFPFLLFFLYLFFFELYLVFLFISLL